MQLLLARLLNFLRLPSPALLANDITNIVQIRHFNKRTYISSPLLIKSMCSVIRNTLNSVIKQVVHPRTTN